VLGDCNLEVMADDRAGRTRWTCNPLRGVRGGDDLSRDIKGGFS